jgi:hypothetical protein
MAVSLQIALELLSTVSTRPLNSVVQTISE